MDYINLGLDIANFLLITLMFCFVAAMLLALIVSVSPVNYNSQTDCGGKVLKTTSETVRRSCQLHRMGRDDDPRD